jgi:hypothetical protein
MIIAPAVVEKPNKFGLPGDTAKSLTKWEGSAGVEIEE